MRLLIDTESEEVINELKSVFMKKGYDFSDDLPESVQEIIDKGLEDVKARSTSFSCQCRGRN